MHITTRDEEGIVVFDLSGRLDAQTAAAVGEQLPTLLADRTQALLNLAKVEFVSSIGLRVFIKTAKELRAAGGALKLCCASAGALKVLEISGLESLLDLHNDEASALAAFKR